MKGNDSQKINDNNSENLQKDSNNNEEEIGNLNIDDIYSTKNSSNLDYNKENNNAEPQSNINENDDNLIDKKESLMNIEISNKEKANLQYEKLIDNSPEEIFKIITEETIEKWKKVLYKKVPNIIKEDCNILNSENTKENVKIVSNDIPRTRFREKVLVNSFSSLLEYFINYYCMENRIIYKQGLNEIIAPFLLLKYKLPKIPYYVIYNLFSGYINNFATNYYYEKTCFSLQSSLSLLTLLLKYHASDLQNLFDKIMVTPEMYGTNWLLTAFCGKLKLHLLYHLMNKIIIDDDSIIIHYLIVAFLILKKKLFFESDLTMVPIVITTISIDSIQEIDDIFNEAIKLRERTPYSFKLLANLLEIFKYHCEDPKGIYEKYKPDTFLTLPIFPSEIFYICYKGATKCPDDTCKNNTKNIDKEDENESKNDKTNTNFKIKKCEYCDMNLKKDLNYILLDLRILEFEGQDEKTGFLPRVIKIEQKALNDENFTNSMVERFTEDKGNNHLIFMTSKTDFFNEFEENFYVESSQESNLFSIQYKNEKEINKNLVNKMSKKKRLKLKEYDNMKKLLIALLENNFPYISFIYGGFETIHEEISKYNTKDLYLLNHDKNCEICKLKQQENSKWFSTKFESFLKKSKTFIKNEIGSIIDKDKDKKEKNNGVIKKTSSQGYALKKQKSTKKLFTMDGISDLVNNYENFVKYCSLIKYKNVEYNESDNQGMLIIQKYYLIILKSKNSEIYEQIDKINLKLIQKAEIKKRNYLNIDFVDEEKEEFNLYVKFDSESDCKKFLTEVNKSGKSSF